MSLNPTTVGNAIAAAVASTAPPPGTEITPAELNAMWVTVAEKILTGAGGVTSGAIVTSTPGVQTGGSTAPGTGSIS